MLLKKSTILAALLTLLLPSLLLAQISFESRAELEKAANAAFDAQEYLKAKPLFSQLLSLDAMEPNYNYRFGVCILYTEADPLKPLPYIEGGASSAGVKPEAHYFLGHAFQLNYRFDNAIKSYEKGKSAGLTDARFDLDKRIAECRNGKILYNEATEFKPAQEKEVIESEFYRPYDFRKLKGKVIPLPPNFKTKYDEKNLLGTVVYTPTSGTALVYASYGEDGANAKDLYRVNRLPSGEWALPQRLPNTINTKYDEDYAFFDEESQTLYFASKGHNTMGGYDVFSSRLDESKSTWSTPVNLQYPINSPFDDFLYLSDPEGEVAFFTTARGTEIGKLKVIKTLLYDPVQVELSVVEGTFEDLTDSVYNYMVATVIDPVTKEVVGKFRSNKLTGKYVLILPPQQGYVMDVAPREADGFKFELDVPKHEKYSPLEQQIAFDANAKDGVVTITNFFDAAGKPDTIANEVAMSVDKVVERMVAMPEPTKAMLAEARQQSTADDKTKLKEQEEAKRKQELAAARQKAVQDSLTHVAQVVQLKAAEEATRQQQLAAARQDSIAKVELALKQREQEEAKRKQEIAAARQKAVQDSVTQVAQATQLKAAEEAQRQQQLAAARQDSIAKVELALKQKEQEEAKRKQELAAARQKAVQDSLTQVAQAAQLKAAEEATRQQQLAAARQDSIAKVELALKQKQEDDLKKLNEMHLAERAQKDSLERERQLAFELAKKKQAQLDSANQVGLLAKAEQEAKIARLKAQQDSVFNAQLAKRAEELAAEEKRKDSIAQVEVAAAEWKQRMAEIEKEVELAQQKAMKDSMIAADEQQTELDYQQLKAEMAQQEAELLQQKPEPTQPVVMAETKVEEKVEEVVEIKADTASATLSDSELFLQTIAKLEKQMEERNRQMDEQAQAAQEAKKQVDVQATAKPKTDETAPVAATVENTSVTPTEQSKEEPLDGTEVVALKSDADPNEYLAALNRIEQQMETDAASRPAKDYELRSMDVLNGTATKQEADPALQAVIDADRKALEEHQVIAKQKEEEMRQKMKQDREVLANYDQDFANEVLEAEKQAMESTTQPVSVGSPEPVTPVVDQKVDEAEVSKVQIAAEMAAIEQELKAQEEPVVVQFEVEESTESVVDAELLAEEQRTVSALAEVKEAEKVEVAAPVVPVITEEAPKVEQPAVAEVKAQVVEPVVEPVTEPTVEVVAEVVQEEAPRPEPLTETVAEVVEEPKAEVALAVEEIVNEVLLVEAEIDEVEQPAKTVAAPLDDEAEIDRVAMLHLMPAALRDYSKRKPDFSQIANLELRRMVQRMRAEEVGRLAVLKNVRNKWVDQGKTLAAAETLKENNRNQDVLSNLTVTEPREEKVRPPFDRNDLRQRQDVLYRLEVSMTTTPLSERVMFAMSPDLNISFANPEVQLQTGYFRTLADARSGMFEYRSRGLGKVGIVAYHQGQPILLSDVDKIPFVD